MGSFDGDKQNSGNLGRYTNSAGEIFRVITPHARARYNGLIAIYGNRYPVALTNDAGILTFTNGTYLIVPQYEVYFREMNLWRKSGPLD